jgi:hypothetical protein
VWRAQKPEIVAGGGFGKVGAQEPLDGVGHLASGAPVADGPRDSLVLAHRAADAEASDLLKARG